MNSRTATSIEFQNNLLPERGQAYLLPFFFNQAQSSHLFVRLLNDIQWKQEPITLFGRKIMQPRLTAWQGEAGYAYSGTQMKAQAWSPVVQEIKEKVENACGQRFSGALLNLYRDGSDSMGWHRDNEKELGPEPFIASVSFGASRTFHMRLYDDKKVKRTLSLGDGSLLVMAEATQRFWEHSVPKTARKIGPRINITFRRLFPDS